MGRPGFDYQQTAGNILWCMKLYFYGLQSVHNKRKNIYKADIPKNAYKLFVDSLKTKLLCCFGHFFYIILLAGVLVEHK